MLYAWSSFEGVFVFVGREGFFGCFFCSVSLVLRFFFVELNERMNKIVYNIKI